MSLPAGLSASPAPCSKVPACTPASFQITSPALALTAIGSYGTIAGAPSLFAYALVPFPLGGPPCFFVTGLAGGFGYNRGFIVPSVDQIATFPFVAWASGPASARAPDQGRKS